MGKVGTVLIVGIFMIGIMSFAGIVSGETNYALSSNGGTASFSQWGDPVYDVWGTATNANDDNTNTYVGMSNDDDECYEYSSYSSQVNFDEPRDINSIQITTYTDGGYQIWTANWYEFEYISVYHPSFGWQEVSGKVLAVDGSRTRSVNGPWNGITAVKFQFNMQSCGWKFPDGYRYHRLNELRAWGDCIPDCSGKECDGDGCGGSCGTCTSPETCVNGVCTAPVCDPDSDAMFCWKLAKNCDPFTGVDNCGVSRTVDCGDCTSPYYCLDNYCRCFPDDDCASKGYECGRWYDGCNDVRCGDWTNLITEEKWDVTIGHSSRITTDGNFIWVTDDESMVYKYDMNGNFEENFDSTLEDIKGITTDGNNIWIIDRDDMVYKYDMNGNFEENFDSTLDRPNGIATDGNFIWIVDSLTSQIYKYSMEGDFIGALWADSFLEGSEGITTDGNFIWAVGSTYVFKYDMDELSSEYRRTIASGNYNPEGITTYGDFLWVVDTADEEVYKYNMWGEEGCDYGDDCIDGTCVEFESNVLEWRDMSGNVIFSAQGGDTVQMVMTDISSGTFEIFEEDAIGNDDIRSVVGVAVGSDLVGTWTITGEDLDKTNDYGDFRFRVGDDVSGKLPVSLTSLDSPMNIEIVSPGCGTYYDEGSSLTIEVSATDKDDFIDGSVSVNGVVKDTFVNGGVSFANTFDVPGNYQIIAEAVNSRGKRGRHISNIMILDRDNDGEYVAACIAIPKDFSDMDDPAVNFDASTTRGVIVSDNGASVLEVIPDDNPASFSWYWRFMPENIIREFVKSSELKAYKFTAEFPIIGDNSAGLRVEFG